MAKYFIRDGRAPIPDDQNTSKVMSSIRGKNTRPELKLRKSLYKNGILGYRIHLKNVPGRPDIAYPSKKIAIFVNGCFWHRCPHCNPPFPKTHTEFWMAKFDRNIERDGRKKEDLENLGWTVLIIWECKINSEIDDCVYQVKYIYESKTIILGGSLRVIDLFCGAGGFSEGFRNAGFEIILAVDIWPTAAETYKANHPSTRVIIDDINRVSNLPDNEFNEIIPDTEIIIGSPPCVAFSNSNRSGKADKTNGIKLVYAFLRIVARKKFKDNSILKYWIMENVPNVIGYVKESYSAEDLGCNYSDELKITNSGIYSAEDYDVPSRRKRFFCGEFPNPIISSNSVKPLKNILNALNPPGTNLSSIIEDPNYPSLKLMSQSITDHHYIQEIAEYQWRTALRLNKIEAIWAGCHFQKIKIKLPAQ